MNGLRIGISYRRDWAPQGLVGYARRAEDAGFDELWVVEDCFYASGIASVSAALAGTQSIKVGLGIMPAVARNPVFTAMEIATIAGMFPGRFKAGIGHGVKRWMEQIGALPQSQMAALEDAVLIAKRLLAGELVTYKGKQYQVKEGELVHPPEAIPPIYLGVRGPRSLALSGRIADGTILAEFSSPAYVRLAKAQIESGMKGRENVHHITMFAYAVVSDSKETGREQMRPLVAGAIASGRKDMYFLPFTSQERVNALRQIGNLDEIATRIPDAWIDQMSLCGTPDDWRQSLDEFANAGVDTVVLIALRGKDPHELDKFAEVALKR